jgi:hypothetical protein
MGAAAGVTFLVKLATPSSANQTEELAAMAAASVGSICAALFACPQLRRHALALLPRGIRLPSP